MRNVNGKRVSTTRLLTLCSVLSALGVAIMYLGSFIEVLDLSLALLASFSVVILMIEQGGAYPWLIYAVTGTLALLLLPNKSAAVEFVCFMGFYPIVKERVERIGARIVRIFLKLLCFNASLALAWFALRLLVGEVELGTELPVVAVILLLNGFFAFYDYALSVLITSYLRVWRKRLRVDRFFGKG